MRSIKLLQDSADKERRKAVDLRKQAEKYRQKSADNMGDPQISMQAATDAQKYEEKASQHDQTATSLESEAADLQAKAIELNRRKNELQHTVQSEIDKLDREEKTLRGEVSGF